MLFYLTGVFTIENVVPTAEGDISKVKLKVRLNIHGIFFVKTATMVQSVLYPDTSVTVPVGKKPPTVRYVDLKVRRMLI